MGATPAARRPPLDLPRELLEEARRRLDQHDGLAALLGHMDMEIDLASDHVAVELVSACLSGFGGGSTRKELVGNGGL